MARTPERAPERLEIIEMTRRRNSRNGNPRWTFHAADGRAYTITVDNGAALELTGGETGPYLLHLTDRGEVWKWEAEA